LQRSSTHNPIDSSEKAAFRVIEPNSVPCSTRNDMRYYKQKYKYQNKLIQKGYKTETRKVGILMV